MGRSRKKLDLTGHRYGKLTVIGPAENIGTRTAWLCRCDCGNEADIQTNRIDAQGSMLCALMHLDPYTLSREDFLRGMWRSLLGGGSGVLFTLMDEYLNVNDREFTQWPHADHATMEVA